ncbi:glycosyltransferase [Peribacillus simplex]|uniref:glycosyltransferase family 4 protein n=1 Tax=Peribacillus simplex TaxID=1478 RepID=UPI000F643E51|nr:glycosyltransferase family 4 protein [Peribacillus simplex]RRN69921.1 glycosyltransferase [Peribacillus simplex]
METIHIINKNFLDTSEYKLTIGGIQTYICTLLNLIKKKEKQAIVYQFSDHDFKRDYLGFTVIGVNVNVEKNFRKKKKLLYKKCMSKFNTYSDTLLFADDAMIVKNNVQRSLAIQHGITWDVAQENKTNDFLNKVYIFKKAIKSFRRISKIHQVRKLVCVDYNFVNWYRTQVAHSNIPLVVIPNSTPSNMSGSLSEWKDEDDTIKIIFARRFVKIRGTEIFASSIEKILKKYKNVKVTIAGEGPEEKHFKKMFSDNQNVNITKYNSSESIEIHCKHDIAVIPTIGSEGTSFSLLEAMASKCAVIATNVGGITNILIDNYNGLLINPSEEELSEAIENLIENKELREKLAIKAHDTVTKAFSRELWEEKWSKVFEDIAKK